MKERPIIMGTESVRAILEERKTQTRRVIKPQPIHMPEGAHIDPWKCPYGVIGDRLWVRETWGVVSHTFDENENICDWKPNRPAKPIQELKFGNGYYDGYVIYGADGGFEWNVGDDCSIETKSNWKSSMFMPRIASRITLKITDIRVEMVQEICWDDCIREGICSLTLPESLENQEMYRWLEKKSMPRPLEKSIEDLRESYRVMWNSLNAKHGYPWEKNPWVWVVTFKQVL